MIISKIKNIFIKKEKVTLLKKTQNEIDFWINEVNKSIPDSVAYELNKLHLNMAMFKLSCLKEFNKKEA